MQLTIKLSKTSWEHCKEDIKEIANFITSSHTIQQKIAKIHQHNRHFDVEERLETAAIHGKGLYNEYFVRKRSRKAEMTFSYQLLIYLSKKANKKTMKKFFGGHKQQDEQAQKFFGKVFRNLFLDIDHFLAERLPDKVANNNYFRFNNSIIGIGNDHSTINASLNINGQELTEEEDDL